MTLPETSLEPGGSLSISGRALFLSASVPYRRDLSGKPVEAQERNTRLNETARPDEIRRAILELCTQAFARGITLVFGGHPAVSPVVLEAAERVAGATGEPLVWVFQSRFFEPMIPRSTLALSNWSRGRLVWTPEATDADEDVARAESLDLMRTAMIGAAPYAGCVVIGGMEGATDEATVFAKRHPHAPLFPLARSGGATLEVFERGRAQGWLLGAGEATADFVESKRVWPLVIRRILEAVEGEHGEAT